MQNVDLDKYVLYGQYDKFKSELLNGITDRPAYFVEIFKRAFGELYHISPILYNQLTDMFEQAIGELTADGEIAKGKHFKNSHGQVTIYTTSYKRA